MERIFITGGTGFVGKRVLDILSKDKNLSLYVVTRKLHDNNLNINYLCGSVFDKVFIENCISNIKPKYLLHLAWDVKDSDFIESEDNEYWVEASRLLLEIFLKNGGKIVVAAGTCFEYDLSLQIPHREDELARPKTKYGKAKLKTYHVYKEMCDNAKVRLVWGRIFYLYGEGENSRKLLSAVKNKLNNDEVFICKTPNNIIDYIQVDEVAKIFVSFLFNEAATGIVNIGTGKGKKIGEMLLEIEKDMGKKNLIQFEDKFGMKIVADIEKLRSIYSC